MSLNKISGDDAWMAPPVPIPNTVVKHPEAESTCLVTGWEDRKLPVRCGARLRTGSFVLLSGGERLCVLFAVENLGCRFLHLCSEVQVDPALPANFLLPIEGFSRCVLNSMK